MTGGDRVEDSRVGGLRQLADRVRAAPARAGGTRVVAVDGPAGSGKTTFAAWLAEALGDAPVVHLDDLIPGWTGLDQAAARLVDRILAPLAAGEPARYRRYDWDRGEYAEWQDVPATPVLIVEGVASGSLAAAPYMTLLIWVEAPVALRMSRGLDRDGDASRPRWQQWVKDEEALFKAERTRERADVRVSGQPSSI